MATRSCSLRVAACRDAVRVTQQGATACPHRCLAPHPAPPCPAHPDGLSPSRASSSSCRRSAAAWWWTEHSGEGSSCGFSPGAIKASLSHQRVVHERGWGRGDGHTWGLPQLPPMLSVPWGRDLLTRPPWPPPCHWGCWGSQLPGRTWLCPPWEGCREDVPVSRGTRGGEG